MQNPALGVHAHSTPLPTAGQAAHPPGPEAGASWGRGRGRGRDSKPGRQAGGGARGGARVRRRRRGAGLQLQPPLPARRRSRPPSPQSPPEQVAAGEGRGGASEATARTRLLVLLVEFFNHLGRLPAPTQTHRNRPRRLGRRAEEPAGRPAPGAGADWVTVPSLRSQARSHWPARLLEGEATPLLPTPSASGAGPEEISPSPREPRPRPCVEDSRDLPVLAPLSAGFPATRAQLARLCVYWISKAWKATSLGCSVSAARNETPEGSFT